jgi:seryl-tRNA synthetase
LLDELQASGLLFPTGVDGVYGLDARFETVVQAVDDLVTREGADDGAERVRFPPVMPMGQLERGGYLKNFPHLAGTVHCFEGDERDHREMMRRIEAGEDWSDTQAASDIAMTPAACYPVYPMLAARGPLPADGALIDVLSWCFRHEPSKQPTRLQTFRMREYLKVGTPQPIVDFRHAWLGRGTAMIESLELPYHVEAANDAFFGRVGQFMADNQKTQELKFELQIPINDGEPPTACMSFNHHLEHFGELWEIRTADGALAHSACVAWGLERLAIALFRHHGFDIEQWPASVRATLWP